MSVPSAEVRRVIGPAGYFTLAFGSMVGSGWVLVLGDWLRAAGPGGAALGFLAGGVVTMCVAVCYGELASRMPLAGGEFRYVLESLGRPYAFAVGWFTAFGFATFTAFEGIAFAWFIEILAPWTRGPVLYRLLGHEVTLGSLLLGIGGAFLFASINYLGTSTAIWIQKAVTYTFMGIVCSLIIAGLTLGQADTKPAFYSLTGRPWTIGLLWIFATSAVFLNGFQIALYAIEERRPNLSVGHVIGPMLLGVAGAVAFYVGVILSASRSAPWMEAANADLSAAFAFGKLTGSGALSTVVLLAASISLLKSWNGYIIAASRLFVVQAQEGMLPKRIAQTHPTFGSPSAALTVVLVINVAGVLLGRGAILPIVDMSALAIAVTMVLCLIVLIRIRRVSICDVRFKVPGGITFVGLTTIAVSAMAIFALVEPLTRSTLPIPIEWILMCAWAAIGFLFWQIRGARSHTTRGEPSLAPGQRDNLRSKGKL